MAYQSTTLTKHLQSMQDKACNLCGLIDAISLIAHNGGDSGSVEAILQHAERVADELNLGLDSITLQDMKG